jgi:predicted secreted protein
MMKKLTLLCEKLQDVRSRKIILVSHCVLNENTRYLGGAFCPGFNRNIISAIADSDCGILQMPCPEQAAWGGVLKKYIWLSAGLKGGAVYYVIRMFYPFFTLYTYLRYFMIASGIMKIIRDYKRSGFDIAGIIGIDGSPACGINKTLGMKKSFEYISSLDLETLNRIDFNVNLYKRCLEIGRGIFMKILIKKLVRNRMNVNLYSLDLQDEMAGRRVSIKLK